MPGFSFGELRKEYETLWSSMKIPAGSIADVDKLTRGIVQGKPRYDQVSNATAYLGMLSASSMRWKRA